MINMNHIDFFKQFLNIKYVNNNNISNFRLYPFYANNNKIPSLDYIKKHGINCIGLLNLYCRKYNIQILNSGGTYGWFNQFKKKNKINLNKLKKGSIVFRKFRNDIDQGHIAFIIDDDLNIIHASKDKKCVCIEKILKNYFEYEVFL